METKELKIQVPEGYEIDKEKSTFEKIVFKKKEDIKPISVPRSWEEYLCSGNHPSKLWFINPASKNTGGINSTAGDVKDFDLNKSTCAMSAYLPSMGLADAFIAMMRLMSMRQEWIGDWEPDWNNDTSKKWCIVFQENKLKVDFFIYNALPLSFPTKEMATDFMNTFKDLLEIAKPLI